MQRHFLALAALVAIPASAQQPTSVNLNWSTLSIVVTPNVGGVYLWARYGETEAKRRTFAEDFEPSETTEWLAEARRFLAAPLAASDTGSVRLSPVLHGIDGGSVYLARRREGKAWSGQIIVFLPDGEKAKPILVQVDSAIIRGIFESLENVSRNASPARSQELRDSTGARVTTDRAPYLRQGAIPPVYPISEQEQHNRGLVLLQFIILPDGSIDLPTIKTLHSTSPAFFEATLEAVTRFRFNPAMYKGKPVKTIAIMPFEFGLVR
jgi:TonB family protein